jgi:hypothetical protein
MPPEPHWILKGLSAAALGALPWIVTGFVLNVPIPLLGAVICCQNLGRAYYWIAYWAPIILGAVAAATILLAWAKNPESAKSSDERIAETAKAAMVVVGLCLLAVARSYGFI